MSSEKNRKKGREEKMAYFNYMDREILDMRFQKVNRTFGAYVRKLEKQDMEKHGRTSMETNDMKSYAEDMAEYLSSCSDHDMDADEVAELHQEVREAIEMLAGRAAGSISDGKHEKGSVENLVKALSNLDEHLDNAESQLEEEQMDGSLGNVYASMARNSYMTNLAGIINEVRNIDGQYRHLFMFDYPGITRMQKMTEKIDIYAKALYGHFAGSGFRMSDKQDRTARDMNSIYLPSMVKKTRAAAEMLTPHISESATPQERKSIERIFRNGKASIMKSAKRMEDEIARLNETYRTSVRDEIKAGRGEGAKSMNRYRTAVLCETADRMARMQDLSKEIFNVSKGYVREKEFRNIDAYRKVLAPKMKFVSSRAGGVPINRNDTPPSGIPTSQNAFHGIPSALADINDIMNGTKIDSDGFVTLVTDVAKRKEDYRLFNLITEMDSLLRETRASFDLYEFLSRTYDTKEYGYGEGEDTAKKEKRKESAQPKRERKTEPEKATAKKKETHEDAPEEKKKAPEKERTAEKQEGHAQTTIDEAREIIRKNLERETAGRKQIRKRMSRKDFVFEGQMSIFDNFDAIEEEAKKKMEKGR